MVDRSVLVRLRADISDFQRKMATAGTTTSVFVKNLETADSRMGNLVQTALALAPALVPISASAVPALAGLTSQAGFAAAGVGVLVAAFNGVGDSLEALNEYQLEPTAENYAKLREEMRKLPAEGREFVRFLDSEVMPALDRLRDVAAAGALPGFEDGIDDIMARLPEVRDMVDSLADASGRLAEETGEGLASDEFDDFFNFLRTEAEPTLLTFGRTVGNVLDGLATTLIGLNPLANDFEDALLEWSRGFADIEPEDFADFVAYVRDVGPDAVDALSAVGGALVALVQAAAPVGEVALPAIEALANVITVVANSAAGPALLGAAAGLSAVSRAVALFNAANGSALVGMMRTAGTDGEKGAQGLTAFGKAAAGLAAVTVVFAVLDELNKRFDETLPGVEDLTGRLLDLEEMGSRGFSVSLGKEFDSLGASVDRLTDPSKLEAFNQTVLSPLGRIGMDRGLREATDEIAALDQALAGIVASAGPEAAEKVLGALVEQGYLTEAQLREIRGELGLYDEALAGAANQERLTADATDELGGSMDDAAAKTRTFKESLDRLNALLDGRANMRDYEAAIDDFTDAMKRNGRNWDINTEKGRENQAMLDGIVGSTLAVAEGMKGAARQRFLTSAIADLREMANRFDIPRSQVRELIRELQQANRTNVNPKIGVDTSTAQAHIRAIKAELDSIDRFIPVNIHVSRTGQGGDSPYLSGGVPKAYGDFKDRHDPEIAPGGAWRVWAEPETQGESYIPHANDSRRPRAKRILEHTADKFGGQVLWFAEGGTTGEDDEEASDGTSKRRRRRVGAIPAETAALIRQFGSLTRAIKASEAAVEKETGRRDALRDRLDGVEQQMADIADAATAGFTGDPFRDRQGAPRGSVGQSAGGSDPIAALMEDIAYGQERGSLLQQLRQAGLGGDTAGEQAALAEALRSGDNASLSSLLTNGQVQMFEDLFIQRQGVEGDVGGNAAELVHGAGYEALSAEAAEQTAELREVKAELRALRQEERARENRNAQRSKDNADRTADGVKEGVNSTATAATRHQRAKRRPRVSQR